jgi:hypothetical protein
MMAPRWVLTVALVGALVVPDALPVTTHQQPPSRAQLQGLACVRCAGDGGELVPAGHVYTSTGSTTAPLGWAVVAHPACLEAES